MKTIRLKDKYFEPFIPASEIEAAVERMAGRINSDMEGKLPLFLVILNGAFIFAADLIRRINVDCHVSFVRLSSYDGIHSTQVVRELIGLNEEIANRTVVVVEDIIDTGHTMDELVRKIKALNATEVKIATCLLKPAALRKDLTIDYIGIEIPNDFIVGYGLDYDGYGRNLRDIYKIVPQIKH
ncbi:MAG TPA: hypoxanthine phosphoribosyltransferase [Bacteroidales bacterium]|nr:hypoxanthine phosphoribosyltransferase [Bacteroidales bacterium]